MMLSLVLSGPRGDGGMIHTLPPPTCRPSSELTGTVHKSDNPPMGEVED
jgi:hypothetical protein